MIGGIICCVRVLQWEAISVMPESLLLLFYHSVCMQDRRYDKDEVVMSD